MAYRLPVYTIRPKDGGDGFVLLGPTVLQTLEFPTANEALKFCRTQVIPIGRAVVRVFKPDGRFYKEITVQRFEMRLGRPKMDR